MATVYSVAGRTLVTSGTINHVSAQLWNPHASRSLWVREVHFVQTAATASPIAVQRSTTHGATPTSTSTPDADNDHDATTGPATGALGEFGTFGTQPTLATPHFMRWHVAAAIGSGLMWVCPTPIRVNPGTGLCIAAPLATAIQAADVTFVWEE